jgi:hypothetical protein
MPAAGKLGEEENIEMLLTTLTFSESIEIVSKVLVSDQYESVIFNNPIL